MAWGRRPDLGGARTVEGAAAEWMAALLGGGGGGGRAGGGDDGRPLFVKNEKADERRAVACVVCTAPKRTCCVEERTPDIEVSYCI